MNTKISNIGFIIKVSIKKMIILLLIGCFFNSSGMAEELKNKFLISLAYDMVIYRGNPIKLGLIVKNMPDTDFLYEPVQNYVKFFEIESSKEKKFNYSEKDTNLSLHCMNAWIFCIDTRKLTADNYKIKGIFVDGTESNILKVEIKSEKILKEFEKDLSEIKKLSEQKMKRAFENCRNKVEYDKNFEILCRFIKEDGIRYLLPEKYKKWFKEAEKDSVINGKIETWKNRLLMEKVLYFLDALGDPKAVPYLNELALDLDGGGYIDIDSVIRRITYSSHTFENPRVTTDAKTLKGEFNDHYDLKNLFDKDKKTAWIEGEDDAGIGKSIYVNCAGAENVKKIGFIIGYTKNKKVFFNNNRVKKLEIIAGNYVGGYKKEVEFSDTMKMQYIDINDSLVSFEFKIKEVYKGKQYNDTCISEIKIICSDNDDE